MRLGERIEQSGLTVRQITQRSGIDRERLNALLGGAEPSIVELRDLATALGMSIADFLPANESEEKAALLFRTTSHNRPRAQTAASAPIDAFSRRVGQAVEILGAENLRRPDWIETLRRTAGPSWTDPEVLAESFRTSFFGGNQISPLVELPTIIVEKCDIILYSVDNGDFDGASAVVAGMVYIFLSKRTFAPRMLFTLAHELGHVIGRSDNAEFASIDGSDEVTYLRPRRRQSEAFADAFAGSLLLPRAGLGIALRTIRETFKITRDGVGDIELLYVARFFGVSFLVAASRCERLGLLPDGGAWSLYESIRERHRNPEDYARELGLPDRPEIRFPAVPPRLLHGAVQAIREGRVSLGRASSILNLSISDLFKVHAGAWQPD